MKASESLLMWIFRRKSTLTEVLESAYKTGFDNGVRAGTLHLEYAIKELREQLPKYKEELVDKYLGNFTLVAEMTEAVDLENGHCVSTETLSLPTFYVKLKINPTKELITLVKVDAAKTLTQLANKLKGS